MKTALLVVAMITCTVVANLLLKSGAMAGQGGGAPWWVQVANWKVAAGLASFGTAALLYIVVLRILPLNVALSYTAAQWVATVAASAFVLSEPIGGVRLIGLALIGAGIAVVASTA
jgi:undecaprenyl phosphate-alpha-L-ara4N flippase subunit ArnE